MTELSVVSILETGVMLKCRLVEEQWVQCGNQSYPEYDA